MSPKHHWRPEELVALRALYASVEGGGPLHLKAFAEFWGRGTANVCRKARALGLSNQQRRKKRPEDKVVSVRKFATVEARRANQSEVTKARIARDGHPRGALGIKHGPETRAAIGIKSRASYARMTQEQRMARVRKIQQTSVANGTFARPRTGTTWKAGWREIGGNRKFYRSKWEANYAYYLEWLRSLGQIKAWAHESEVFWFDGIKRGSCSYLPDFKVTNCDDSVEFHEVKGWMDSRSKTKIRRMAKYHPKVKLVVIVEKGYNAIKRKVAGLVPGWEP